jgi:hypothetical protein
MKKARWKKIEVDAVGILLELGLKQAQIAAALKRTEKSIERKLYHLKRGRTGK